MALQVSVQKRQFVIKKSGKDITLPDPHPSMTIPEVVNFYKPKYPEISTASMEGPKMEENRAVYSFKTVLGTKG